MSSLTDLIRGGFTRRQAKTLLDELATAGGGGGGGSSSFGGQVLARSNDIVLSNASADSGNFVWQNYTFSNPGGPTPGFELVESADGAEMIHPSIAGWYHLSYQSAIAWESDAAPDSVHFQMGGYYDNNNEFSLACSDSGADYSNGGRPGVHLGYSEIQWLPSYGADEDNTGYIYARARWAAVTDLTPEFPSGGTPPWMDLMVTLLAAT